MTTTYRLRRVEGASGLTEIRVQGATSFHTLVFVYSSFSPELGVVQSTLKNMHSRECAID